MIGTTEVVVELDKLAVMQPQKHKVTCFTTRGVEAICTIYKKAVQVYGPGR
jgi:hypothetical protein